MLYIGEYSLLRSLVKTSRNFVDDRKHIRYLEELTEEKTVKRLAQHLKHVKTSASINY